MFCCTLLYVHSSIAIILMRKRELVALLNLSSWCLVVVERFFLAVPWGCLRFVIVVFPDHTYLLFFVADTYIQCISSSLQSLTNIDVFCSTLVFATKGAPSECQQQWPEYGGRDLQSCTV